MELEKQLEIIEGKLNSLSDVIAEINELKKERKDIMAKLKLSEPQYKETADEYILSLEEVPDDKIKEMINDGCYEYLNDVLSDIYYDETIDDDGLDHVGHFLIGSRLFEFEVHYDAEWCSEWSMRCNIIDTGSRKLTRYHEIPKDKFEITYNDEEVGKIFNAKIRVN